MSTLKFDGQSHQIELLSKDGNSLGKWPAFNNIDSAFAKDHYNSARHLSNGIYDIQDKKAPTSKPPDANGSYGSYGIIHFNYPGHPGVGVHSGRANAKNQPGPQHATHGCVRTSDEAMSQIKATMATDPLQTITITGNSAGVTSHGHNKAKVHHPHGVRSSSDYNPSSTNSMLA